MSKKNKSAVTPPGTVEKIIPTMYTEPEKAEISIERTRCTKKFALRIVHDQEGNEIGLKPGAEVDVIEAEPYATIPKKPAKSQGEEQEKSEAEAGKGQKA